MGLFDWLFGKRSLPPPPEVVQMPNAADLAAADNPTAWLARWLSDLRNDVRRAAIETFGPIRAITPICDLLVQAETPDDANRLVSPLLSAARGPAIGPLAAVLDRLDAPIRHRVVVLFTWGFALPETTKPLVRLLFDADLGVRDAAQRGLSDQKKLGRVKEADLWAHLASVAADYLEPADKWDKLKAVAESLLERQSAGPFVKQVCGSRPGGHSGGGCVCPACGWNRGPEEPGHDWDGCVCKKCNRKKPTHLEGHNPGGER